MSIVTYASAPKVIAAQLEGKASAAGWQVVEREIGVDGIGPAEGDGRRYRTTFRRGEQSIRTSVYRLQGKTILMVVILKTEP